ncbi:MAG: peptide-methionine (S)-S-oxide reductase MsrA [Bacteroidetes bacterium]|nr:peptide-methionine (S)-S-oxide reductase MsrA [Bacteroidota bacterium]
MINRYSIFLLFIYLISCNTTNVESKELIKTNTIQQAMDTITFGAGCFWCVEAIFSDLNGVESVVSGYAGGTVKNPSYKEVCTGSTGHAEVCQVTYDPTIITYKELLEVFWQVHDPTTLNRQGGDVGTQYRSAIFYHTNEQKEIAEEFKKVLNNEQVYPNPIVTEITAFTNFYPAEDYHQDYFELNGENPYCSAVVKPKVEKFRKVFKDKLKN